MADNIKIAEISEETKTAIRRKTAEILPDNPTAVGMKADDIKAAFFRGITDGNFSVLRELERVITEANAGFDAEENARSLADEKLDDKITAEATKRETGDTELVGKIDAEISARENTDAILSEEKSIRQKAVATLQRRLTNLEYASTGNIYNTVEESDVKYTTQLPDALPYGILSRIGCYVRWTGDNEASYDMGGGTFYVGDIPENDGEFVIVSEASEVQISDYADYTDDNGDYYSIVTYYTIPTNKKVKLSEVAIYCEDTRDGSTWNSTYEGSWGISQSCSCTSSFKIIHGNVSPVPNPVTKVEIGLPYTLVEAKTYSGVPCTVTENTVIMPKGYKWGVLIPCELPSGAKVTVYADGENDAGEKVYKFIFRTSSGNASTEANLGTETTLTAKSTYLMIYKSNPNTASTADLEIRNIKVVLSNPNVSTLYATHTVEIPEELITYLNDNGYAYGAGLDETCYNYLDLTARVYRQYCKIENDAVVELSNPVTVDVSGHLASDLDIVPLLPSCLVRFVSSAAKAIPYIISYKTKLIIGDLE